MTAKIKLNSASGGGSFSLQAPSSSSNDRVITLPDVADGTLLTSQSTGLGKILQVIQTVKTDTFSMTTDGGGDDRNDITGLSVSITPSSTSSKILVQYSTNIGAPNGGSRVMLHLMRGSSDIFRGDQDSGQTSQTRCSNHINSDNDGIGGSKHYFVAGQFLDSPSTTSATTYKLQLHGINGSSTFYVNRNSESSDNNYVGRTPSQITVMEVSA